MSVRYELAVWALLYLASMMAMPIGIVVGGKWTDWRRRRQSVVRQRTEGD